MTPAPSSSPRAFGKYLLDDEIARGGMSRVYLARLRGLGGFEKRLVVKQVLPELARDPRFVSMFVTEAKTLVQMSHPHIAPVYELGVVDGIYFLAMEYVEGATLAAILGEGPLPVALAAHLGAEICDALHYAHTRFGVVHRDVTPRNVIVDGAGHSRLLDFGVAAPADVEGSGPAELFGTPGYLSPEQRRGDSLDGRSDVFALAAVLYEAIGGRRAFPGMTLEETSAALEGPGPDLADLPAEIQPLLARGLARDRSERFETARAFGRALRQVVANESPEGVAPELGARAEAAEERREAARTSGPPDASTPSTGALEVRTLATSRLLDALIEPGPVTTPGTTRLSEAEPPLEESGTVRLPGRERRSDPDLDEAEADEVEIEAEPDEASADDEGEDAREDEALAAAPRSDRAPGPRAAGKLTWVIFLGLAIGIGAIAMAVLRVAPAERTPTRSPTADLPLPPNRSPTAEQRSGDDLPLPLAGGGRGEGLQGTLSTSAQTDVEGELADEPPGPSPEFQAETEAIRAAPPPTPEAESAEARARTVRAAPAERPTSEESGRAGATAGSLTVSAAPWAEVRVDGRLLGTTPLRGQTLRPGRHRVELSCPPLGRRVETTVNVEAGEAITVTARLDRDPPSVDVRVR